MFFARAKSAQVSNHLLIFSSVRMEHVSRFLKEQNVGKKIIFFSLFFLLFSWLWIRLVDLVAFASNNKLAVLLCALSEALTNERDSTSGWSRLSAHEFQEGEETKSDAAAAADDDELGEKKLNLEPKLRPINSRRQLQLDKKQAKKRKTSKSLIGEPTKIRRASHDYCVRFRGGRFKKKWPQKKENFKFKFDLVFPDILN